MPGHFATPQHAYETWHADDPRAMLTTVRVPLAIVLASGAVLILAPQMRDMLAALGDDWFAAAMFHLSALLWGLSSWYWARTSLIALHGSAMRGHKGRAGVMFRQLPRAILLLAFGLLAIMILRGGDGLRLRENELIFAVTWGALLLWVVRRTKGRDEPIIERAEAAPWKKWSGSLCGRFRHLLSAAPGGRSVALFVGVVLPLAAAIWVGSDPVGFARVFPGPAAALVGLAAIVPPATLAVAVLDQWDIPYLRRFPAIASVLIWSLLVDTPIVQRHPVRLLEAGENEPAARLSLKDAAKHWLRACAANDEEPRVVIVAAAGGAGRAALWTTTVLADLEGSVNLHRHLFAISAVSGGAHGAAVHVALRQHEDIRCTSPSPHDALADTASQILSYDVLGPTLAGYLFQDTWQLVTGGGQALAARAFGLPPDGLLVPDRATAMEKAFSAAWRRELGSTAANPFESGFLALWYRGAAFDPTLPLLFQNGAVVGTGRRIITAPVDLGQERAFAAIEDLLSAASADVRLSTSVTNSARFPYLTPSGEVNDGRNGPIQVVDGGYVDSLGGTTAWEIAAAVEKAGAVLGKRVTTIVVAITPHGDVTPLPQDIPRCRNLDSTPPVSRSDRQNEMLAPFAGLAGTRAGHAALTMETLRERFCEGPAGGQRFFHFYLPALCENNACEGVPLNWTLSRRMRDHIRGQMDGDYFNRAERHALKAALQAQAGPARPLEEPVPAPDIDSPNRMSQATPVATE